MDPIKSAIEMVRGIRVSSVLGSILFITPFALASLVVVSFSSNITVQTFLIWVVGILIGLFVLCYLGILLFGDHKELQSEDHEYQMKRLDLLGDQRHSFTDFKDSIIVTNPNITDPKQSEIPDPKSLKGPQNNNG